MFVPAEFTSATILEADRFIVRKLLASDARLDLDAVNSSIEIIKKQRGGTWPKSVISLAENTADLEEHESEFNKKTSFAYCITTLDGNEELGCIYFYPPGSLMNEAAESDKSGVDAVVNFWISQKAFDGGLYDEVYNFVENWLKSWPFKNPYISNPMKPKTSVK